MSVSSTLDSAVWPYWLKLFVPEPAGDSEAWLGSGLNLGIEEAWPDGSADGQGGWAAPDLLDRKHSLATPREEEGGIKKNTAKKTEGQNTRGGPETLMLSSHNNLIYFYLQQSSQEEEEVYGQSSKKQGDK